MPKNQKGGTLLLVIILIFITVVSGGLYRKFKFTGVSETKTVVTPEATLATTQGTKLGKYTNLKYGYSIQFPPIFTYREFPDTKTGAGFLPLSKPGDLQNEIISINVLVKNADMVSDSLSDYVKVAASIEIQNYTKLNSIEEIKTLSGLTGYKTTWNVLLMPTLGASPSAQTTVSLPITYFDLPKEATPSTVQVTLNDPKYLDAYNLMIKTFSE